ncbi:MAG: hypothetical protein HY699_19370 [Deltaproteobacteria bacterium]|nr:hypothetical protein [Deltaproteobacteria bacterium]
MRADLRLTDLRGREKSASKLMNVKIPVHISDAIQRVARDLGASKTEVVIALLNEGLDVSTQTLKGWKPPKENVVPPKRVCSVKGCGKAYVAKGYCANHYQAWRRGKLPA